MSHKEPMRVVVMGAKDDKRAALMMVLTDALDAASIEYKPGVNSDDIESVVICDE